VAQPRGSKKNRLGDVGLMERTLSERFGTPTSIVLDGVHHTCTVEMDFHSVSELKGLLATLECQVQTDPLFRGRLTFRLDNTREANAILPELGANTDSGFD